MWSRCLLLRSLGSKTPSRRLGVAHIKREDIDLIGYTLLHTFCWCCCCKCMCFKIHLPLPSVVVWICMAQGMAVLGYQFDINLYQSTNYPLPCFLCGFVGKSMSLQDWESVQCRMRPSSWLPTEEVFPGTIRSRCRLFVSSSSLSVCMWLCFSSWR